MIGDNLQQYTYEYLMQMALNFVPEELDKRQGSVIYDALAPFCQVLAAGFMELRNYYTQTYALTATGEDLDSRVAEQGITRYPATHAVKLAFFADDKGTAINIPLGSRFSTVSDTSPINYRVSNRYYQDGLPVPGYYELTCEESGTIGNEYSGNLINITFIQGLASATMTTLLQPARDIEDDEELRQRYFETLNQKAFGGNIADYRQKIMNLDSGAVGAVQIYPTWNGGGTVKLSILDAEYNVCSEEFLQRVQEEVDPENSEGVTGDGLGVAPIGHQVTIVTPIEQAINVSCTLTLRTGYTVDQVRQPIGTALENYLLSLRKEWDNADEMNRYSVSVFIARVTSAIISVPGVTNVTNVLINNSESDVILPQTGSAQYIPKLGEVVLNV